MFGNLNLILEVIGKCSVVAVRHTLDLTLLLLLLEVSSRVCLTATTLGQCGDPGEDVSVIADRYFEKLGSIADQGPQARGLQ